MDMPPSRYKVVEKGRRLVVVDTLTGEAVTGDESARQSRIAAARRPARTGLQPREAFAPAAPSRSAPMRGAVAGIFTLIGFPVLIVGAVLVANARKPLRTGITGWLDGLEEAQALSSNG